MPRRSSSFLLLVFLLGLVGCDHATKRLAETRLRGHAPTTLIANVFELRYTENRDVAFSLLRRVPPSVRTPLIFVAGAVGHGLLLLLWWRRRNARWGEQLAYAIILAGALGNLTDRLVRGYVVDFLYVHHWPVFNVADICLVVGVGLMLLMTRHQGDPAHPTAPPTPAG